MRNFLSYKYLFLVLFLLPQSGFAQKAPPTTPRVIHVFVALCDNASQGIVPVPAGIGDGDKPHTNLYWGCGYGIKTFFRNSPQWKLLKTIKNTEKEAVILERLVFKHDSANVYLVADAYRGSNIREALDEFLDALNGVDGETLVISPNKKVRLQGYADLLAYIGHNGLMEFSLPEMRRKQIYKKREGIVLACSSADYFSDHFKLAEAHPLLWTTNLMAPEAYTLEAVIEEWIRGKYTAESIRKTAGAAYHKYQKCGLKPAERLFKSGF